VNGKILANGITSVRNDAANNDTGAGAGGSIWIDVSNTINFGNNGLICANGGNVKTKSDTLASTSNAGGGGRIAIYAKSWANPLHIRNIQSWGGKWLSSTNEIHQEVPYNDKRNAKPGTIYLNYEDDTQTTIEQTLLNYDFPYNPDDLINLEDGIISAVGPYNIYDQDANFIPDSLIDMKLYIAKDETKSFTIIGNTSKMIFIAANPSEKLTQLIGDPPQTPLAEIGGVYKIDNVNNQQLYPSIQLDNQNSKTIRTGSIPYNLSTLILDNNSKLTIHGNVSVLNDVQINNSSTLIVNGTLTAPNLSLINNGIVTHDTCLPGETGKVISLDNTTIKCALYYGTKPPINKYMCFRETSSGIVQTHYYKIIGYSTDSSQAPWGGFLTVEDPSNDLADYATPDPISNPNPWFFIQSLPQDIKYLNSLTLNISNAISIDATSSIHADGKGYTGGSNELFSDYKFKNYGQTVPLLGIPQLHNEKAGFHGGMGGKKEDSSYTLAPYDSITQPEMPGSGGYSGGGSHGGGVIKISASAMTVDGKISANGLLANQTGGGAGGSLWLDTNTLGGSGAISANGGNFATVNIDVGFGGGGGRVALYYTQIDSGFNQDQIYAKGGYSSAADAYRNGGAGTIYLAKKAANGVIENSQLIIDNADIVTYHSSRPYSTFIPSVADSNGARAYSGLSGKQLTITGANYIPGSLVGLKLNITPTALTPVLYSIVENAADTIWVDTDFSSGSGLAIGEIHATSVWVTGKAQVLTYDRIIVPADGGTITIDTGSVLQYANKP
jgi:hypothetical protein